MLMTRDDFRTKAGLTRTTWEGGKIKTVQTKLAAYHNAGTNSARERALGELSAAVEAWRKAHTPTANKTHKARSRGKRRAMDELYWQVEATIVDEERSLVMTRDEFRTMAGIGRRTHEGEGIQDVQNKLVDYHAAVGGDLKSAALLALKASCESWREDHVTPTELSDRSSRKKAAMDQLSWQIAVMKTDALPDPLGPDRSLARRLYDKRLTIHDTSDNTAGYLRQLMGMMRTYHDDMGRRPGTQDPSIANAVRIATVDLHTFDLLQKQPEKFPKTTDGIGNSAEEPPAMNFDQKTQQVLVAYLKSLLSRELHDQMEIALAGANLGGKHRAQISVDYYYARDKAQVSLHKDTTGNTLFVMLHYVNKSAMTGPEYVWDRWPVAGREDYILNSGETLGRRYYSRTAKSVTFRPRAPWSTNSKFTAMGKDQDFERNKGPDDPTHFWPNDLIEALELARAVLPDDDVVQMSEFESPYALISFVDELVYHSTPLTRKRREDDSLDKKFNTLVTGMSYYLSQEDEPTQRRRAMSVAFDRGDFEPKSGFKEKRSFLRLWISVTPKPWYKPFENFKRQG